MWHVLGYSLCLCEAWCFLSFVGSSSSDTCTLRMCNIYDTETGIWTRGPNMNEERSYHGLVRISDILYAVGGCGQLNSMESLYLSSMDRYAIDNQLMSFYFSLSIFREILSLNEYSIHHNGFQRIWAIRGRSEMGYARAFELSSSRSWSWDP